MDVAAIIVALSTLLTAIGGVVVLLRQTQATKQIAKSQDSLAEGQEVIRKDVNSNMSNAIAEILAAKTEISALKLLLADLRRDAGGGSRAAELSVDAKVAAAGVQGAEDVSARNLRAQEEHPQVKPTGKPPMA